MAEFGFRTAKERQQLYEPVDGGARSLPPLFSGLRRAWRRGWIGADYLPFWPQTPILVGYLAQLAYVALVQQSGGVGK